MKFEKSLLWVLSAVLASLITQELKAAGFETLPISGASVYVSCRSGNGMWENSYPPAADSACVSPNGVNTSLLFGNIPEAGFSLFAAQTFSSPISYFSDPLATLNERVWRNSSTGECIYGKQVLMSLSSVNDYNPYDPGVDALEVNDFAFGGYAGTVSVAYAKASSNYSSVIRIGRTFTSVQRQHGPNGALCSGFLQKPSIGGAPGTEINGVGVATPCSVIPTVSQQEAPLSANWVDFTTYASAGTSPEGMPLKPSSPNMYIKQACANANTSLVADSMKLRQTGRAYQPWVVVTTRSRAPSTSIAP
ncbi:MULTISPECIES: hypothetical protein [unclassified Methylophilus]|uniref:hypothetical protein n=1 Tax=unclassified Methylophilus TaxID=2630143 RepID=UPI0006F70EED|nr:MULTISPECIES: hypothetical protein [unclassified Methylophilus]KQT42223.1 hypothetical protein ASG34_05540 [Methylophilus sp. Leaf416]KQT56404.1 hypothetical protein ASG44_05515 [Methylophilus sp. Leaf459]